MIEPKLKAALSDIAGECMLCKQQIVGNGGYVEFWEFNGYKYHKECLNVDNTHGTKSGRSAA